MLMVLALIIGMIDPHIELSYPAASVALLLIYVNVQLEQQKRITEQEKQLADSRSAIKLSQIQPHFLCYYSHPHWDVEITQFFTESAGHIAFLSDESPAWFWQNAIKMRAGSPRSQWGCE